MPWTPILPNADFGLPLISNLKAIVERDQTEALAWAAAKAPVISTLADFARVLECERISNKFPSLAIYPVSDAPDFEDGITQVSVIGFEVEVTGRKPEELARELQKRVAAVRMMAVSAPNDLIVGMLNTSKIIYSFGAAQFEQVRESQTDTGLYYRSAVFTITFRFVQGG
jgi:hypothetical protein